MAFNRVDRAFEAAARAAPPLRHRRLLAALPVRSSASPHFTARAGMGGVLVTKPIIEAAECS